MKREYRVYEIYELILSEKPIEVYPFDQRKEVVQRCLDLRKETGKMYRIRIQERKIHSATPNSDIPLMEI